MNDIEKGLEELSLVRHDINKVDKALLHLLHERTLLLRRVYKIKSKYNLPLRDVAREKEVLKQAVNHESSQHDTYFLTNIFKSILSESLNFLNALGVSKQEK